MAAPALMLLLVMFACMVGPLAGAVMGALVGVVVDFFFHEWMHAVLLAIHPPLAEAGLVKLTCFFGFVRGFFLNAVIRKSE